MATKKEAHADSVRTQMRSILEHNGFTSLETQVFETLFLDARPYKATELSRKTKIGRTTLYGTLKTLMDRGFVLATPSPGVTRFYSVEPEQFVALLERTRAKIDEDIKRSKDLLPLVSAARSTSERDLPTVQFFSGVQGIKAVYNETLANNKDKTIYEILGTPALYKLLDFEYIQEYMKKRSAADIHMNMLAIDNRESRFLHKSDAKMARTTTLVPSQYDHDISIVIYGGNKTAITSLVHDHPLAVVITDEKIASAMKKLFTLVQDLIRKSDR